MEEVFPLTGGNINVTNPILDKTNENYLDKDFPDRKYAFIMYGFSVEPEIDTVAHVLKPVPAGRINELNPTVGEEKELPYAIET